MGHSQTSGNANGYFSNDQARVLQVAANLKKSGVNSLLLSRDAFHKEYIPLEKVYPFAKALSDEHIEGFKLHPAWVVNGNIKTRTTKKRSRKI
jgi:uncharacterized radical SAM superfamily protein